MIGLAKYNQILGAIVLLIAVNVMNVFGEPQGSAESLTHDKTVFGDVSAPVCVGVVSAPDLDVSINLNDASTLPFGVVRANRFTSARRLTGQRSTRATPRTKDTANDVSGSAEYRLGALMTTKFSLHGLMISQAERCINTYYGNTD